MPENCAQDSPLPAARPAVSRWHLHRRLYDWTLSLAERRHSTSWLAGLSFAESSFFPVPPDVLLIPLVMGSRRKAMRFATVCTVASVLGGLLGYLIGFAFWETAGQTIVRHYRFEQQMEYVREMLRTYDFWFVFIAGLTPIPYKVFTIAAGLASMNPLTFAVASLVGRGSRFYAVSVLLYFFGEPIKRWIDKYFNIACVLFTILLIGGFFAIKYLR